MVAGHEHERLPAVRGAAHQLRLERRAAVGQVADEEHRAAVGGPLQHVEPERVVVQVGGDGDHRAAGEALPPAGVDHQPREADELRVELLVEHAGRAPRRLDRLQRARDVRAVGVVLRVGDLAAGRDQDDHRDADPDGDDDRERDRPAQPRDPAADRERHQQAERRRARAR